MSEGSLLLSLDRDLLEFGRTPLVFSSVRRTNLFANKNNKTLAETVRHRRYVGLSPRVIASYSAYLDVRLGDFLVRLKTAGDPFYRNFLNRHGDRIYCEFRLGDRSVGPLKGLYCFVVGDDLRYIGKSIDSFAKRINQGYGQIHPKNCYRDGQSTNCHLNALIAEVANEVSLYLHPMVDDEAIKRAECILITNYNPDWNVQLRTDAG